MRYPKRILYTSVCTTSENHVYMQISDDQHFASFKELSKYIAQFIKKDFVPLFCTQEKSSESTCHKEAVYELKFRSWVTSSPMEGRSINVSKSPYTTTHVACFSYYTAPKRFSLAINYYHMHLRNDHVLYTVSYYTIIVPLIMSPRKIVSCPPRIIYPGLDNSGRDSRNLIGQLQVSKHGRNLERDSKCQCMGGILSALGT